MSLEQWLDGVPPCLTRDSFWPREVYRLAVFCGDLAWDDASKLGQDDRTLGAAGRLFRAVGSVSANIAEWESRRPGNEQAHFYGCAIGSAREARGWYYQGRRVPSEEVTTHRAQILTRIIQLLLPMIQAEQGNKLAEHPITHNLRRPEVRESSPLPGQNLTCDGYAKVTAEIVDVLCRIAGPEEVFGDVETLESYAHDEAVGLRGKPKVVVQVTSAAQIAAILRLAQRERVPVTPRGAGYGRSGGTVPACGGTVVSTEDMNQILEMDAENLMVTVEPSVITGNLHRACEAKGLFYPPDPASLDSCSIGGNVAENACGPRAVKYGVTRRFVCGLEAVLPSGEIITCGGILVKNITGYDLIQLLAGSEGALAIITKIILRVIPLPKVQIDLLVPFDHFQAAVDTVSDVIAHRTVPTTMEFMERDSILAVEELLQKELPHENAAAHLLIQLDGNRWEEVDADLDVIGALSLPHGARDVLVSKDSRNQDRLWLARRSIIDAFNHGSPINHLEDMVVPRAQISNLLKSIKDLAARHGVRIISFGHAGDGNVPVNVLKDDVPDGRWDELLPRVTEEIYRFAVSLGGMITGEHGVGATRRRHLPLALDDAQIEVMRQIREAFDPNHILNPRKVFL